MRKKIVILPDGRISEPIMIRDLNSHNILVYILNKLIIMTYNKINRKIGLDL